MKKIIFDCDNTMGVEGCDVDDGLALLYLLGKDVEICGITTTYGNSDLETVHDNTARILAEIGRSDIPLLKGCPNPQILNSEAAHYMVETVNEHRGEISILATGSLTNLYGAYLLDKTIFEKTVEVILMGGITEPLIINGKGLDELNFACDPIASECVLRHGRNVSVITGNNCLQAFFTEKKFNEMLLAGDQPAARYIRKNCMYWFQHNMAAFNLNGFHNWDVVAASYLADNGNFRDDWKVLRPDRENLEKGLLTNVQGDGMQVKVNLPMIKNLKAFTDDVYDAWLNCI